MRNTAATADQSKLVNRDSALFDLFVAELKDIYWAEKHIVKNLPKMAKEVYSDDLKMALQEHVSQTEHQVERLEEIFQLIGVRAVGKRCEGMDGLIDEAKEMIDETEKGTHIRDAAMISSAQKIEHYEIASYGTLKTFAAVLALDDKVIDLLNETLEEEKNADIQLTEIAESHVNEEAKDEED